MDIAQDLQAGTIFIGFTPYLNRLTEKYDYISALSVDIRSVVGELLWLNFHVFESYLREVKALARRVNKPTTEALILVLILSMNFTFNAFRASIFVAKVQGHIF